MKKLWLLVGIFVFIVIGLISCDRLTSKPPKSRIEKAEKLTPSVNGAPSPTEEQKPAPEIKAEAPPEKETKIATASSTPKEIAPPGSKPPREGAYIYASPTESFVRLASAETFPAVYKRVVAQFTPQEAAKLPRGWEVKEFAGVARAEVVKIDGVYALQLKSAGTSFSVHKDLDLDLRQTPYLTWSWKVDKLPPRGDVRSTRSDDQAAQIYLVFPYFPPTLRSKLIGYIWDSTTPKGTILQSPTINLAKVIVVESGNANLGRWITVTRNVYEDYKILFGTEPPKLGKVAIHINTNRTQSSAESYFANIFFHSAPTAELK